MSRFVLGCCADSSAIATSIGALPSVVVATPSMSRAAARHGSPPTLHRTTSSRSAAYGALSAGHLHAA